MAQPGSGDMDRDATLRQLGYQVEAFRAVGKAQARYIHSLLGFIALVWGVNFVQPSNGQVAVYGVPVALNGLWTVAPAIITVLTLGVIGTLNAIGPVWWRLSQSAEKLREKFWFSDLDTNRNIVDYIAALRINPEVHVEPREQPQDISRKGQFSLALYPLVISGAVATTLFADYPHAPGSFRVYCYGCAILQVLFGFRILYRQLCRYFGWRKEQTTF